MAIVEFNKKKLIPSQKDALRALYIGGWAVLLNFLIDFFSLARFLDFLPDGWKLLVRVAISVYLSGLLIIKINGKEVV